MHYEITEHGSYMRGVIGDSAGMQEFVGFYTELQNRCRERGLERALVVVRPENEAPGEERLLMYQRAGFGDGFKLALVCATWTLYQACNKAEMAAAKAAVHVRAFVQEMEAVSWLTAN
jgi:hypothetical protein